MYDDKSVIGDDNSGSGGTEMKFIYICIYICMYVCTHTCMYVYTYVYICIHLRW
jgi:hypothetical protein